MFEYLGGFNSVSIVVRLILATILGGIIGMERSSRGQAAGIRTFSLVCLGAAVASIIDEYLITQYVTADPARMGSQVISGIGFLGAGSIIVTGKNYVKGLATAASLWATACLGLAIGSGYIFGSLIAFALIVFVMTVLSKISHTIDDHLEIIRLYVEVEKDMGITEINEYVKEKNYRIVSMEKQKKAALTPKDMVLVLSIDLKKMCNHADIMAALQEMQSIHYLEEIR